MDNQLEDLTALAREALGGMLGDDIVRTQLVQSAVVAGMDESGLLDGATMQGGSVIAGCYGGLRLSADLDFEMDELPTPDRSESLAAGIERSVRRLFGADVYVKKPAEEKLLAPTANVPVCKWLTRVEVLPDRPDVPRTSVKLEIARLPHDTSVARRYENSAARAVGIPDEIVMAEDVEELVADKVVSLLGETKLLRVRDVWDLSYLVRLRRVNMVDATAYAEAKIERYQLDGEAMRRRVDELAVLDWPKLLKDQLAGMMTTEAAHREVAEPRRAAVVASEAFDAVRQVMGQAARQGLDRRGHARDGGG